MIPEPGSHGGDGFALARALGIDPDDVLDLSQSLNPLAPDVAELAGDHLAALRRYPDSAEATRFLADHIGTEPGRVLLTNGASEAINLVAAEVGGTVRSEPDFGLYPRLGHGPLWASNPNNPTGVLCDPTTSADVWDEAFYPLATGTWTRGDKQAIVIGSLTKIFACPGLRIGYIISDEVGRFAARQPEWPVNNLALSVLPEVLQQADLGRWQVEIASLRTDLIEMLRAFDIATEPSDAPWVLAAAPGLRAHLAPHGVLVRDCTSFGLHGHVRIAVPDGRGLAQLERAMKSIR